MVEARLEELLKLAIQLKATDIHLHLSKEDQKIQMRTINGFKMVKSVSIDAILYQFLKFKANLDLSAAMVPQSGTFTYVIDDTLYNCRYSALETIQMRSAVIRILNLSLINSLDEIGGPKEVIKEIRKQLLHETGLILFAGVTGSGKTTTMFTALSELKDRSIYTLEDPIETYYDNLMQVQINLKTGLNYQRGIKQLLRHDPDIICLGEIRSPEEAKALFRCCLSGHLVTSTIHASSLFSTLSRLLDFQVSVFDLSLISMTIVFQRLIVENQQRRAMLEILSNHQIQDYLKTITSA